LDLTAVAFGLISGAFFLAWALDVHGWTTRLLRATYRFFGEWIWPFGDEDGYVRFNRYGAWFGVVLSVLLVVIGVTR
jgi:hypothetical protein